MIGEGGPAAFIASYQSIGRRMLDCVLARDGAGCQKVMEDASALILRQPHADLVIGRWYRVSTIGAAAPAGVQIFDRDPADPWALLEAHARMWIGASLLTIEGKFDGYIASSPDAIAQFGQMMALIRADGTVAAVTTRDLLSFQEIAAP